MEQINKRFEDINRRFEDINRRFEDINKRFEQLYTFLWIIVGIFTSFTIGFAMWDRRTIVRRLLAVLRELAKDDPRVAEALRKHGLAL